VARRGTEASDAKNARREKNLSWPGMTRKKFPTTAPNRKEPNLKRRIISPAQYEKQREENRAVEESAYRKIHNLFSFWCVCRERQCRRAQACVGDVPACFARHWPHVPEHMKVWLRTCIKARCDGFSVEEAVEIGAAAEAQALARAGENV
jgi:hypothetical protein